MKLALLCTLGLEDACVLEVAHRLKKKAEKHEGYALVDVADEKEAVELCYFMQTTWKILLLLSHGLKKEIKPIHWQEWLTESFAVRAEAGEESREVEETVGALIQGKVNLTTPQVTFFVYTNTTEFLFGADLTGFNTAKRSFKLFQHNDQLKGSTAASLIFLAHYDEKKSLLDPLCGSGLIPIEAAHIATGRSINYYAKDKFAFHTLPRFKEVGTLAFLEKLDKKEKTTSAKLYAFSDQQQTVRSAEKNAKLAGVNKLLQFSRQDLGWLDTKIGEKQLDLLVTKMIEPTRMIIEQKVRKIYQDFFYASDFILKGAMYVVLRKPDLFVQVGKEKGYTSTVQSFKQGKEEFSLAILKKG